MLIKRRRGWEIPEKEATSESAFQNRRRLLKTLGFGALLAGAAGVGLGHWRPEQTPGPAPGPEPRPEPAATDPSAGLYPMTRNPRYVLDRPITDEKFSTTYNNFYEFGAQKTISRAAQALPIRPWAVTIDGMVEKPMTIDIDDLLKRMPLEERLYRHRCVEAWSMAVPWSGFAMKDFVDFAKPLGSTKYVRMETFLDTNVAPGQKAFWYPWPYVEGLTMAEATNELAFLVIGMYGKPVPPQDGAPLRLHTPWKYGFKSIKSVVKFTFTDKRPVSFWEALQSNEYGFWANVNPDVPHPRWSQATERVLGTDERRPTVIWNGYGEFVAHLYGDLRNERLFA